MISQRRTQPSQGKVNMRLTEWPRLTMANVCVGNLVILHFFLFCFCSSQYDSLATGKERIKLRQKTYFSSQEAQLFANTSDITLYFSPLFSLSSLLIQPNYRSSTQIWLENKVMIWKKLSCLIYIYPHVSIFCICSCAHNVHMCIFSLDFWF